MNSVWFGTKLTLCSALNLSLHKSRFGCGTPALMAPSPRTVAKGVEDQSAAPRAQRKRRSELGFWVSGVAQPPGRRRLKTLARSRRKSCFQGRCPARDGFEMA